ncbi:MAG TPA: GIY-YIG nuclease family protein [Nitrospirota bacterium]|nr:GIY-YIG nuclease family protein [Nitrospirota bacterium]
MGLTKAKKKDYCRWYLYILKCCDGSLYTGIARDLHRRVRAHNSGTAARYTRSRLPVSVIYQERCRGRSSALRKEYAIKQLSKKEKEDYIRLRSGTLHS